MSSSLCLNVIGEVVLLDQALDAFEFGDVLVGRHVDEPAGQRRLDQDADLVDIADEILVDRPDARAAVGREDDEALAAQQLQRLAHRVGRGAVTLGEVGDHEPLVGCEPPRDDVFADQFIERGALAGGPDGVNPRGWLCFEIACFGQSRLPKSIHTLLDITHGFRKQCTILSR